MTKTYLLVDISHLMHRCKHVNTRVDAETRAALGLHVIIHSIKLMWKKFNADHVVICADSWSWRKQAYEGYKSGRRVVESLRPTKEQEDDKHYFEVMNEFVAFLRDKTNVTLLHAGGIEGDDWVAFWIETHPTDNHVIISGDSDFYQLIAPNVTIYNGVSDYTITLDGVTDGKGKVVEFEVCSSGKLKIGAASPKFKPETDWHKWALFLKIMRGDPGDSIMTAYPRANKKKLREAFDDKNRGYCWNNIMNQTWKDENGNTIKVSDAYKRNVSLIDLQAQPPEIKTEMGTIMQKLLEKPFNTSVGFNLLKFCNDQNLVNLAKSPNEVAEFLNTPYRKPTMEV